MVYNVHETRTISKKWINRTILFFSSVLLSLERKILSIGQKNKAKDTKNISCTKGQRFLKDKRHQKGQYCPFHMLFLVPQGQFGQKDKGQSNIERTKGQLISNL